MIATQTRRDGMGPRELGAWALANLLGWATGLWLGLSLAWGIAERIEPMLGSLGAMTLGWLVGGLVIVISLAAEWRFRHARTS